jgi:hypothetical protein
VSAVRFLFDEDFNRRIVRGLRARQPRASLLRAQDIGMSGASDAALLEWAARRRRVLVSHDRRTMRARAEERVRAGRSMAGLILVRQDYPVSSAIDDLLLISEAASAEELRSTILFLPL